jgi:hypothetical protein
VTLTLLEFIDCQKKSKSTVVMQWLEVYDQEVMGTPLKGANLMAVWWPELRMAFSNNRHVKGKYYITCYIQSLTGRLRSEASAMQHQSRFKSSGVVDDDGVSRALTYPQWVMPHQA